MAGFGDEIREGERRCLLLKESRDRRQAPIDRIRCESKSLQREHPQEWLCRGIAEDGNGRLRPSINPDLNPGHRIRHLATVRQYERPLFVGADT